MASPRLVEQELLDQALDQLRAVLGEGWELASTPQVVLFNVEVDALWAVHPPDDGAYGEIAVEAKTTLPPVIATELVARLAWIRETVARPVLVVSPWLSPRTREVLEERGLSYLDLTGNILLRLDRPAIFIKTRGADQNPMAQPRGRRGWAGPRAGRLVRELVDFEEPRRASELVAATGLNEGYVSHLLKAMSDEALIRRAKGRLITDINWQGLLRARAASYQLLKANHVAPALARQGRGQLLQALQDKAARHPVLATGSLAAQAFAPIAVGGALMLYVPPGPHVISEIAKDLGLLRIDQSADADVLLLQPMSDGPFDRPHPEPIYGLTCVGLSQLVLDCLSGPGRMPAEGEAVLTWMGEHEDAWRRPSPLGVSGGALR